eukprot:2571559-Lingulodinium_polyedra.AAC.1
MDSRAASSPGADMGSSPPFDRTGMPLSPSDPTGSSVISAHGSSVSSGTAWGTPLQLVDPSMAV